MKRREFIAALGGATVWPLVSRAQPTGKVYRIGILETVSAAQNAANIDALRNGLQKLGYVDEIFLGVVAEDEADAWIAVPAIEVLRLRKIGVATHQHMAKPT